MSGSSVSLQFFGAELRRERRALGLTQEQLGEAVRYSTSMVAMIESGKRPPSPELATLADDLFKTDGRFTRIREHLILQDVDPDWFRPWRECEQAATALRSYELSMVPGLLQTEEYARALLRWAAGNVDDLVPARLERQKILRREKPPTFVVVLDETVLRRPVGGAEVMHGQLRHLVDLAEQVIIQVVPAEVGAYQGLDGAFVIATVDGQDVVFVDTPVRGYVVQRTEMVADVRYRWDIIKADALPRRQSLDLITEVAERWKNS